MEVTNRGLKSRLLPRLSPSMVVNGSLGVIGQADLGRVGHRLVLQLEKEAARAGRRYSEFRAGGLDQRLERCLLRGRCIWNDLGRNRRQSR